MLLSGADLWRTPGDAVCNGLPAERFIVLGPTVARFRGMSGSMLRIAELTLFPR